MEYEVDLCEKMETLPVKPDNYVRVPDVTAAYTYVFPVTPANTKWILTYYVDESNPKWFLDEIAILFKK